MRRIRRRWVVASIVVLAVVAAGGGVLFYRIQKYGPPDESQLHVMNADGTGTRRISVGISVTGGPPSWSPDGKTIVFEKEGDICLLRADGRNERCITSGDASDELPQFSPDGSKIVFSSESNGKLGIWLMDADGEGKKVLSEKTDWGPVWSPDGQQIMFTSGRKGKPGIYVIAPDGTGEKRLTNSRHESGGEWSEDQGGSWSPDGRHIAFTSTRSGGPAIYIMNADGTGQRRLVGGRKDVDEEALSPAWSPDGQLIAFQRGLGSTFEIWVIRPDGSGLKKLTTNSYADMGPSWSPDATQIAFMSTRSL